MISLECCGVTRSVTSVTSRYLVTKINVRLLTSVTTISGLSHDLSHLETALYGRLVTICDNCDKKLPIEHLEIAEKSKTDTCERLIAYMPIYAREVVNCPTNGVNHA